MQNRFPISNEYGGYQTLSDGVGESVILGGGKFGITLQAYRERQLGSELIRDEVAIKVIRESVIEGLGTRDAVIKEILALRALQHPNLVRYIDCGEKNEKVFLVMELCKGGDLSTLCSRFGAISEIPALRILLQVCRAVEEAHRKGFIHRDLKPSNILLAEPVPDQVTSEWFTDAIERDLLTFKVVDFGLVGRSDGEGVAYQGFIGSPHFCSPEQARQQALDIRSDIYSLGITLWYLIMGRFPLGGNRGRGTMRGLEAMKLHTLSEPHDSDFPESISTECRYLLSRMVAKDREERFHSTQQVVEGILQLLGTSPSGATAPPIGSGDGVKPAVVSSGVLSPDEWGVGNEGDFYEILSGAGNRSVGKFFKGRIKASRETVGVTYWAAVGSPESENEFRLRDHLRRLYEVVCDDGAPIELTRFLEIRRTESMWCVAEEWHTGLMLDQYLAIRNRPLALDEAFRILHPLARGVDYLYECGFHFAPLNVEEVKLLGGESVETMGTRTVGDWWDWGVRFSSLGLPDELYEIPDESGDSHGKTISGVSAWETGTINLRKSFCRLLYRLMEGAEVAIAADWDRSAYVDASRLSALSNSMLRDYISGATVPASAVAILRDIKTK